MDEKFDERQEKLILRAGFIILGWLLVLVFGLVIIGWEFLVLYVIGTWLGFYFCILVGVHKVLESKVLLTLRDQE